MKRNALISEGDSFAELGTLTLFGTSIISKIIRMD
jgi:hypothetical protein